jgi:putative DNA methylase
MAKWSDLFTRRQIVALSAFSALVQEAHGRVKLDAISAGLPDDERSINSGGVGAAAYADAVGVYLAFGVDKMADRHSALCTWDPTPTASGILHTFARQALPMNWDYAEGNPFSQASGNFEGCIGWIAKVLETSFGSKLGGFAASSDASVQTISTNKIVSTDPPYYDNIGYADLSDFFYVWLRHALRSNFPGILPRLRCQKRRNWSLRLIGMEAGMRLKRFFSME